MTDATPCPLCGTPISDTAYVCHRCSGALAQQMLDLIDLLCDLEDAITRQTALPWHGSNAERAEPKVLVGPRCDPTVAPCDHASCDQIIHERRRWDTWDAAEPPLPHERPLDMDAGAREARWVLENTVTTWACHISEERGRPIPDRAAPPYGRVEASKRQAWTRVDRCECCDLPTYSCHRRSS